MDISNEDADEILEALTKNGFRLPFSTSVVENSMLINTLLEVNRNALRLALESTKAWSRYRIY